MNVLFDKCSRDQLVSLGAACGLRLQPSGSFDPIAKILELERGQSQKLWYKPMTELSFFGRVGRVDDDNGVLVDII